jgi:hypothetical protein
MIATMPTAVRIGPDGTPDLTLGWDVLGWTAEYLLQPDGPRAGEPWRFTPEQARFILWWYAVDRAGRFVYRSGVLRRMKGWGKDPVGAVLCAVELVGPCRFETWLGSSTPKVVPHAASWVQAAAVSKDQTRNTMTLFPGLFTPKAIAEYGIDLGKEIIYAHGGRCRIEAVTSSPRALEGGRATFILENETHHWLDGNEGHEMAEVISRNAGKSRDGSSRVLAITNAHRIGEESVAERDWTAYLARPVGMLYDSLEAPDVKDLTDAAAVRAGLVAARGDSDWLDVDRLTEEILDPRTSDSLARRFYLNQLRHERSDWIAAAEWAACDRDEAVPDGALIVLGFDGSHYRDATALVGTVVETGYQWVIALWERPELAPADWEVPIDEVNAAAEAAFARYDVWRLCADPWGWEETLSGWNARYAEKVVFWRANLLGPMARLIKEYETAVRAKSLGHEQSDVFARHVANCVKRPTGLRDENGDFAYVIAKDGPNSPRKIDVAMAAVLSWRARLDAIAAGATSGRGWSWASV